jgi:hypothetical protein
MSFLKSKGFKYFKNLIIGLGASAVMLGALYKIQSWEMPVLGGQKIDLLTLGLVIEAVIFAFLGIIGPDKDYYWDKLYPGLDDYGAAINPLSAGPSAAASRGLDADIVENKLGGMLNELQGMSASLGSLKALQEVDFSQTGEQLKSMNNFYTQMNSAMESLSNTVEDTKLYADQMQSLNKNLSSLNGVYGNVLGAFRQPTS